MPFPIENQACSTWALSGDESRATSIHTDFSILTDRLVNLSVRERREELGGTLQEQRQEAMRQIGELRDDTEYEVDEIYLCGGFMSEEDIVPSHYWIEDRTHGITTDTFINRSSVVVVNRVGRDGEEFQPGCEGGALPPEDIVRIRITGYTKGQVDILTNYTRPEAVIDTVIQTKREEITSSTRQRAEAQNILDHLDQFPHRDNAKNIRELQDKVVHCTNKIQEMQEELLELEENRPERPALPQLGNNGRIDITVGNSPLRRAMEGAVQAREEVGEEIGEDVREEPEVREQQSSSLLRGLNSSLGRFIVGVGLALAVTATLVIANRNQPN
jgi:hypothetical protein